MVSAENLAYLRGPQRIVGTPKQLLRQQQALLPTATTPFEDSGRGTRVPPVAKPSALRDTP